MILWALVKENQHHVPLTSSNIHCKIRKLVGNEKREKERRVPVGKMVEFQIHSLKTFHVLLDMSKQVWWQQVCCVGSLLILLQTKDINYKTDLRLQSHQFKRKPQTLNLRRFAEVWEKVFNLAQWNFRGGYCNLIFTTKVVFTSKKAKQNVRFHFIARTD